jgi:hypothetical protein
MRFLLRSAFWLGLVFHAMPWGDARLTDVVPEGAASTIAGLASQGAGSEAASAIAQAVLRSTLDPREPAQSVATARPDAQVKTRRASVDTLSATDRLPPWRGAGLRGTL